MSVGLLEKELENCLQLESEQFQLFGSLEEQLIQLIRQKKWLEVDDSLSRLKEVAGSIEQTEEERNRLYTALCERTGYEQGITQGNLWDKLAPGYGPSLCRLQRELKEAVQKVRGLSDGILLYSRYIRSTIDDVLKEIFPHRKGKIYSPLGRAHTMREEPVVLDQHF